jgi:hypothetical protein
LRAVLLLFLKQRLFGIGRSRRAPFANPFEYWIHSADRISKVVRYWSIHMINYPRFSTVFAIRAMQYCRLLELKIEFTQQSKGRWRPAGLLFLTAFLTLLTWSAAAVAAPGSRVTFNDEGIALVDGKPFFPIGVFTYNLDPTVLAELREVHCNTVLHGFNPDQLNLLHDHGLMAVCETSEPWIKAAKDHPALLAWYLTDEPENRGVTPEGEHKRCADLKKLDPNHPISLCHTSYEALTKFKDACDVTMTDIYPITKNRDMNIMGVSIVMDEARRIHGQGWPQWTYIQTFGGPETDGGVWAVPLPHEVRFMAYQALVHRATGILYFSYWPQQPRTWQSLAMLNKEIQFLVPWLVAAGRDSMAKVDDANIQVRVRTTANNKSGLAIAINTTAKFTQTTVHLPPSASELSAPFEDRALKPSTKGELAERFSPYGVHVYTWGAEPNVLLAREQP